MRRGEIWWTDFPPPLGHRPAILLTRDRTIAVRTWVTVVPLTGCARGLPVEVPLGPRDGVPRACVANADNILTVPKSRVTKRVGPLAPNKLRAVEEALRFALAL